MDRGFHQLRRALKKLMIVVANSGSIIFKKNRLIPDRRSVA
jgi:hypothetical protein